jgi:DNA-directed RNA polymerase specialized sigma24 family protein
MPELKKNWVLNQEAFRKLLAWLDEGKDSGGERYIEIRQRLKSYFDRKNCLSSDELADETLNRIARKLEEKGSITDISALHYCYMTAKFVFLENVRSPKAVPQDSAELPDVGTNTAGFAETETTEENEKTLTCLEKCLAKLAAADRDLILEYYRGERRTKLEARSGLAMRLALTMNALGIRACRIRSKLEACVNQCYAQT